jgi:hypothetical protein
MPMTVGPITPLGFPRLRVVELILALFRTNLKCVDEVVLNLGVLNACLDLFFSYPWNNFLHAAVEQMVAHIFRSPEASVKVAVLTSCKILDRIVAAGSNYELSATHTAQFGFLQGMTSRILDAGQGCPEVEEILNANAAWKAYLEKTYDPLRQIEETPLGGMNRFLGGGGQGQEPEMGGMEEEEEPDGLSTDLIFRSYTAQQGFTQEFPEEFNKDDYEDEDAEIEIDPEEDMLQAGANRAVAEAVAANLRPPTPIVMREHTKPQSSPHQKQGLLNGTPEKEVPEERKGGDGVVSPEKLKDAAAPEATPPPPSDDFESF